MARQMLGKRSMKAIQENKLAMYGTVIRVCEEGQAIWLPLGAFATNYAAFKGLVQTISTLAITQGTTRPGVKDQKESVTGELLDQTMVVAGAVAAYAVGVSDPELEAKVSFSRSDLARMRDEQIDDQAEAVRVLAGQHLANLADYGVTSATLCWRRRLRRTRPSSTHRGWRRRRSKRSPR